MQIMFRKIGTEKSDPKKKRAASAKKIKNKLEQCLPEDLKAILPNHFPAQTTKKVKEIPALTARKRTTMQTASEEPTRPTRPTPTNPNQMSTPTSAPTPTAI